MTIRSSVTTLPNGWESKKIGIAGEPILIEQGYLMIYHAVDDRHVYRLGAALLDRRDPTKVLKRLPEPILEPELPWEREATCRMWCSAAARWCTTAICTYTTALLAQS